MDIEQYVDEGYSVIFIDEDEKTLHNGLKDGRLVILYTTRSKPKIENIIAKYLPLSQEVRVIEIGEK